MTTAIQPAAWRVSMGTTADHNHWHYFGKKPKTIDDGEIWEPLYSASTLESLQRENDTLRRAQSYTYIGRDGKSLLARDLEDRAEAAEAEVKRLRSVLQPMAEVAGDVSESWPDDAQVVTEIGHFRRARTALASTGGEHHAE